MHFLRVIVLLAAACGAVVPSTPATGSHASAVIEVGPGTCFLDADGDGHGRLTVVHADCGDPGYSYDNTDCNDSAASRWRTMRCRTDADHDGAGSGSTFEACTGTTCESGGFSSNDDDCNDSDENLQRTRPCYVDDDADHYGAGTAVQVCASLCSDVANRSDSAGDCNDADWAIHPYREELANGIDDDCDAEPDLARPIYGVSGIGNTSSSFDVRLALASAEERDAAADGELWGRVSYRKLEGHSGTWSTMPDALASVGPLSVATFPVTGLEALKAYEVRVDLFRGSNGTLSRIRPLRGCLGNSQSVHPCSNSDVYYTVTLPTWGRAKTARARIVLNALYEYAWFRTHALGNWDDSLKLRYQLAQRSTAYCSEFYANAAQPFLVNMNPCNDQGTAATSHCDPGDSSNAEDSVGDLKSWFGGSWEAFENDPDFTSRQPGDWLGVRQDEDQPWGRHSQMFLAYDAQVHRFWFVEGNGGSSNGSGELGHTVNVGSDSRCQTDGNYCPASAGAYCPSGCFMIRGVGTVNDTAKVD